MPGKSGIELYDEISHNQPDQAFLFMSGHHRESRLDDILQNSNVDFIGKPFSKKDLVKKIKELTLMD